MARPIDFDIQNICEQLVGTTTSLDSMLPDGMDWEDLTTEDHAYIDSEIFQCDTCGWWCHSDEMSISDAGQVCEDCSNEEEEDEE